MCMYVCICMYDMYVCIHIVKGCMKPHKAETACHICSTKACLRTHSLYMCTQGTFTLFTYRHSAQNRCQPREKHKFDKWSDQAKNFERAQRVVELQHGGKHLEPSCKAHEQIKPIEHARIPEGQRSSEHAPSAYFHHDLECVQQCKAHVRVHGHVQTHLPIKHDQDVVEQCQEKKKPIEPCRSRHYEGKLSKWLICRASAYVVLWDLR
jgi:hypothetical protein